jgi:hypothetical protein
VERVKYEISIDKGLKKGIQNVADKIIKGQRQTCSLSQADRCGEWLERGK